MKKILQMIIMAALLVPLGARVQAQDATLTTCNGTATDNHVPIYGYYADEAHTVQMIYPADSLTDMNGMQINSMKFYISATGNGSGVAGLGNWNVSLGEVTGSTLSSLNTTDNLTLVYSGALSFNSALTEMTVLFDDGFLYNGGNLLVEFALPMDAIYQDITFIGCTASNASYNSNTWQSYNFLPRVTFTYGTPASCLRVQALTATGLLSDGMTLNWVDTLNSGATYTLTYTDGGSDTTELYGLSGNSYTLTGLDANTTYYFSIVAECYDGSSNPLTASFKTDCENGSCNITFNMTDSFGDGWTGNAINVISGGAVVGSATVGQGASGTAAVPVCAGDTVRLTFTTGSYPEDLGGTVTDGGGNVIFTIANMDSYSNGALLATVGNPCPDCNAPSNLTDSVDADGNYVLSWNSNASTFMVYAGDSLYDDNVTDNHYTFTGLSAASIIQLGVATICDNGDTSGIARHTVITPCGAVSVLPWVTGFESDADGTPPLCWTVIDSVDYYGEYYPMVYQSSWSSHTGVNFLYLSARYDDDTSLIVTPPIAYDPNNMHVQFWARSSVSGGSFEAGIMTDPYNASTFHPYITLTSDDITSYSYAQYEFFTDTLGANSDDTVYLAFRLVGAVSNTYNNEVFVDDVTIKAIPNCRMPLSGSGVVDDVTYESAHFAWDGVSEDGYDLMLVHFEFDSLGNATDTIINHIHCDSTSTVVNSLAPHTLYYAFVATLCDDGVEIDTTEYLSLGSFTTQMRCYPVYMANLVAVNNSAATINWHYRHGMGIAVTGAIATLTDLSNPNAVPVVQIVTDSMLTYTNLVGGHRYAVTLTSLCGAADTADTQTLYFTPHVPECGQYYTDAAASGNSSAPLYSAYNYWWSQAIYHDSMLVNFDTLTGVAYNAYFAYSENTGVNNFTLDMYVKMVDTASLTANNNDYYLSSSIGVDSTMTQVADDYHLSVTGNGWAYIPFDVPFGLPANMSGKRLLVTVVGTSDSRENGSNSWRAKSEYSNDDNYTYYYKARYAYNNTDPINPANPGGYTASYVPNIQFFGNCSAGCLAPTANATNVTGTSVDVQWLANGSETSWQVQYKSMTDTAWTLAATVTASPYTITGLSAGTGYQVRVGAVCTDTVVFGQPVTVFTSCVPILPPYSVIFTAANPCWSTNLSSPGTYGYNVYSSYYLISPEMGAPLDTLMLRITGRTYSTDPSTAQKYYVAACNADGSNRVPIDTLAFTSGVNTTQEIFLVNYSGTQNHFIIASAGGDIYIHDVEIGYLPACMPVSSVTLTNATVNSLTLSWIVNSPNNGFTVKYRRYGTDTWSTANTTGNGITLTGLTASSNYEVVVVTNCTDGTTMSTTSLVFATECIPEDVPYSQTTFDVMPACWSTYYTGHPSTTWEESVSSGYGYIYSRAVSGSTTTNDWLMTPAIAIPTTAAADSVMLVYEVAGVNYYSTSVSRYELLVSPTAGSNVADFTDTLTVETVTNNTFDFRRFSMSQYAGDTIRIAFRSTCADYGLVAMVDFGVRSVLAPLYYLAGNGTVFSGVDNGYKAVHLEGDSNNVIYSWTSTMAAAGLATMSGETTDSITINYSVAGFDTLVFVATNQYGSDTSRGVVRIYECSPVSNFPYHEDFEALSPCYTLVYADNDPSTNAMGVTSSFSGSSLTGAHDGSSAFRFSSYSHSSDYNQYLISRELAGNDMTLSFWYAKHNSSNEQIRVGYSSTTNDTAAFTWGTWLSPTTSWTEFSQAMPAGTKYFAIQYYGDYLYYVYIDDLTITGLAAQCEAPTVAVTAATETSISISINGTATDYEVACMAGAWTAPAAGTAVSANTYTFSGLTDGTDYAIGVRAVCGVDDYSPWKVVNAATVLHPCAVPTGLAVTGLTANGGTVSWVAGETDQTDFEVNIYTTTVNDTISVQGTTHTFTGLYAGTNYNVRVRAVCSANNHSEWTAPIVLTPNTCARPTGVNATAQGSTVNVSWDDMGVDQYRVEWYDEGFTSNGQSMMVSTNSATITDLEGGQAYDIYVYAYCSETAVSEASNKVTVEITGINGVDASHIALYPNPASTKVTIDGIEGEATVTVVDMNGRTVFTASANDNLTIDLRGYAKGAYFVRIAGERTMAIRKLVVK